MKQQGIPFPPLRNMRPVLQTASSVTNFLQSAAPATRAPHATGNSLTKLGPLCNRRRREKHLGKYLRAHSKKHPRNADQSSKAVKTPCHGAQSDAPIQQSHSLQRGEMGKVLCFQRTFSGHLLTPKHARKALGLANGRFGIRSALRIRVTPGKKWC